MNKLIFFLMMISSCISLNAQGRRSQSEIKNSKTSIRKPSTDQKQQDRVQGDPVIQMITLPTRDIFNLPKEYYAISIETAMLVGADGVKKPMIIVKTLNTDEWVTSRGDIKDFFPNALLCPKPACQIPSFTIEAPFIDTNAFRKDSIQTWSRMYSELIEAGTIANPVRAIIIKVGQLKKLCADKEKIHFIPVSNEDGTRIDVVVALTEVDESVTAFYLKKNKILTRLRNYDLLCYDVCKFPVSEEKP